MKLLYCEACGDIISPNRAARVVRWCQCERHAVWWEDPVTGVLRVHDSRGRNGWPNRAAAWVLGLHNSFLAYPYGHDAESVKSIIDATPDSYIFKRWESLVIRIRPGESGDTRWAALPEPAT